MIANDLRRGDFFVEHSEEDWAKMSPAERRKAKPVEHKGFLGQCRQYADRIHMRTSRGDWCIPKLAPAVRLEQPKHASKAA